MQTNSTTETVSEPVSAVPDVHAPARALRPSLFYLIVALVFASDQLSKMWVLKTLPLGFDRPIFGNAFMLTHTQNQGGAWGVMPQNGMVFILFAAVAIVALVVAYHRMHQIELFVGTAFALALGGAMGNLLDRLRFGSVVDFFNVNIIHWPIFNVADSAITIGIGLLLIHFVRSSKEEPRDEIRDKR